MQSKNETAQTAPAKARSQAPDVVEDPTLSRLLFCEILLEEYEGMTQPEDDTTPREIKYESMYQPELNKDTLKAIRSKIQEHWSKDEPQRTKDEFRFEGDTVKSIYKMIVDAQIDHVGNARKAVEKKHEGLEDVEDKVLGQVLGESYKQSRQGKKDGNLTTSEAPPVSADRDLMQQPQGNGKGTAAFQNSLTAPEAEKLAAKTLRSALCLSGGGIRSATFNLGILQGLARHGLLGKFDYLSTVSGGGFIGGWLSAWIRRAEMGNVLKALQERPETPLTPDPPPVEHLRVYSNYLSPQPGLLSADTWTLIATFVRNLVLNWLVFVPVLLTILLLPRMWTAIVLRSTLYSKYAIIMLFVIGFLSAVFALRYVARNLPTANDYKSQPTIPGYKSDQQFIFHCLIWQIVSAMALSVCLWWCYRPGQPPLSGTWYVVFFVTIMIVPLIVFANKVKEVTPPEKRRGLRKKLAGAIVLIMSVQVIVGFIASAVINLVVPIFHTQEILYSIFSVPIILLLVSVEGLLITGSASWFSKDDDHEWWARAGAWLLIVTVAWILVHSLVVYGPLLLLALGGTLSKMKETGLSDLTWSDIGTVLGTVAGVVSGAVTLLGGFSAKTPANSKEAEKAGTANVILGAATRLLAPIFLGFLIILLSLATNWLLVSRPSQFLSNLLTGALLPYPSSPLWKWHTLLVQATSFRFLLVLAILMTLFGFLMGVFINTNVFSLQFMWRNRIIRAYLGASNQEKRHPDPFTGFDSLDNLQMHELWPQPGTRGSRCGKREDRPDDDLRPERFSRKLFHVLNMALNLTGGEKLQWQDRKAESFTVSPLHSGSYWLGYRRSTHYGGKGGITLGASIAISGAFVSPNMGFMMTSPVVRFLMALFNVRFGWWLGNPGPAGEGKKKWEDRLNTPAKMLGFEVKRPFRLDSPRLSIKPFLSEAIGNIDHKSSYVYLSDGGHFENLGLYEMVLRRCRFIVVSDATTDPEYSFESLAQSIRQIRVDLGVPIDIPELTVGVPSQDLKSKYCAVGKIYYSRVDRDPGDPDTRNEDFDGVLVFIKPSLIGKEPRDVVNYWQGRATFPQEVITDQWFSEAQFESYRTLGSSIIEAICGDANGQMTLAAFSEKAREHNQLNFSVFRNEADFMALEHQIKKWLQDTPAPDYGSKVSRFMQDLIR